MHSRLPLSAGVPGKAAVAVLTAALLITGCTPNAFGPPETSSLEHLSAAEAAPVAAQHTAEATMARAAAAVAEKVHEAAPAGRETASADITDRAAEPSAAGDAAEQKEGVFDDQAGVQRHREQLESWSQSVSEAQQAAEEHARREAEEAEAQRAREEAAEAERLQAQEAAEAERRLRAQEEAEAEEATPPGSGVLDPEAQETSEAEAAPQLEQPPSAQQPSAGSQAEFTGDLNQYLQDLVEAHPGEISVSLQEITGQQRSAAAGGTAARVTASTYKLYVAYSVIRQVEAGALSWSDPVTGGRDLAQCFQDMIAVSDNPCPESIGEDIGWTTIYSDAAAAGAASTGQGGGAIVTTAQDLTSMLSRLEAGQLSISEAGHDMLRSALAANVHRLGIPAGSGGQVLNKPGWIDGYIHDAAIVRHPQGTYVLSIMSEGSSWESLASITRDLESALFSG